MNDIRCKYCEHGLPHPTTSSCAVHIAGKAAIYAAKVAGGNPIRRDFTAARRTAEMKERLLESGGKRMSLNLNGERVRKLDVMVSLGIGSDHSDVIRRLIDAADYPCGQ